MAADALPTESELIRRFRDGDEGAFSALLDRCEAALQARIDRRLTAAVQRRVSVADVFQEVRFTAFNRRRELEDRGPGSFQNWLLGIADLTTMRTFKRHAGAAKRAVNREVTLPGRPATSAHAGDGISPSQGAIAAEETALARRALEELPPDYREILRLAMFERLTLGQAGERMGRSREAAKKLYARALVAFTEQFVRTRGGRDG